MYWAGYGHGREIGVTFKVRRGLPGAGGAVGDVEPACAAGSASVTGISPHFRLTPPPSGAAVTLAGALVPVAVAVAAAAAAAAALGS